MLSFRPGTRIFISTEPTDMRKGFDGLSAIVDLRRQLAFPSQRQLERPREGHASRVCCFV